MCCNFLPRGLRGEGNFLAVGRPLEGLDLLAILRQARLAGPRPVSAKDAPRSLLALARRQERQALAIRRPLRPARLNVSGGHEARWFISGRRAQPDGRLARGGPILVVDPLRDDIREQRAIRR